MMSLLRILIALLNYEVRGIFISDSTHLTQDWAKKHAAGSVLTQLKYQTAGVIY